MIFPSSTATIGLLLFILNLLHAHGLSTQGKEFYFAFFADNVIDAVDTLANDVYVSASSDTNCSLTYDKGRSVRFNVLAGSIYRQQLPDNTQLEPSSTGVQQKGMHLRCTKSVWAYAYNGDPTYFDSNNAYTLLPVELLEKEYVILGTQNNPVYGIVATSPNTRVIVHLKSTCSFEYYNQWYGDGAVMNFSLSTNEVLQFVHSPLKYFSTRHDCDFSGTVIRASAPVAVFSGSVYYGISGKGQSHMMTQLPPVSAYSKTTIIPHLPLLGSSTNLRILASHDNTSLSIVSQPNGNTTSTTIIKDRLKPADFSFPADQDLIIQSDKPVMVLQATFFFDKGSLFMFVPGIMEYETNYIMQSLYHSTYYSRYKPVLTIVSETSGKDGIYINGMIPVTMVWRKVNDSDYSVGTMTINETHIYHVKSTSPILVRIHLMAYSQSYGFIGGYRIPTVTDILRKAIHSQCHRDSWLVTVNVNGLHLHSNDINNIYLGINTCTGNPQGDLLTFNLSYHQCHTEQKDIFGNYIFKNTLWYNAMSADNTTRNVLWLGNITCYSHTPSQVSISGQIQGIPVEIKLFQDDAYQKPFAETNGDEQIGQFVYVQVLAPNRSNLIMIINTCDAHLTNALGKTATHPLISHGCPVDVVTRVTESRNQVTRFFFQMYISPLQHGDIYVTCDVTFCDSLDFSPKCQLGCHTDQHPAIIGK